MSSKELIETFCSLVSKGGNFLLNIGPAADGTIPVIMQERLLDMGKWLSVNGDAIYGTRIYTKAPQEGTYYTKKGDKVYAITNAYPFGSLTLDKVDYNSDIKAKLLAHDAPIAVENDNGKAKLVFPQINPDEMKCGWLYAFELDGVK